MKWRVEGADIITGEDRTVFVEATDERTAGAAAKFKGVMPSSICLEMPNARETDGVTYASAAEAKLAGAEADRLRWSMGRTPTQIFGNTLGFLGLTGVVLGLTLAIVLALTPVTASSTDEIAIRMAVIAHEAKRNLAVGGALTAALFAAAGFGLRDLNRIANRRIGNDHH